MTTLLAALTAERARAERLAHEQQEAMAVLAPNMPESGLVDACRQIKQVAISEADNSTQFMARAERAEQQLVKWEGAGLLGVIRNISGFGPGWPDHGNAPLAIVASYAQLHNAAIDEATARHAAESDAFALREWQADVTSALGREGGAHFVDVPSHIRALRSERDREATARQEAEKDASYHRDCRPNRQQAEAAMADAKAMNDKWADEVAARREVEQELDAAQRATANLATIRAVVREWQQAEAGYYVDADNRGGFATFERLRAARAAVLTCQVDEDTPPAEIIPAAPETEWECQGCLHAPHSGRCGDSFFCPCAGQPVHDVVCQHHVAADVSCPGCHSGFFPQAGPMAP